MTAAPEREIDTARQDGPSTMLCTGAGWWEEERARFIRSRVAEMTEPAHSSPMGSVKVACSRPRNPHGGPPSSTWTARHQGRIGQGITTSPWCVPRRRRCRSATAARST